MIDVGLNKTLIDFLFCLGNKDRHLKKEQIGRSDNLNLSSY